MGAKNYSSFLSVTHAKGKGTVDRSLMWLCRFILTEYMADLQSLTGESELIRELDLYDIRSLFPKNSSHTMHRAAWTALYFSSVYYTNPILSNVPQDGGGWRALNLLYFGRLINDECSGILNKFPAVTADDLNAEE